jgi:hypothetical protein
MLLWAWLLLIWQADALLKNEVMPMFWQDFFHTLVNRLSGKSIPLRIQLWNGTEIDFADNPLVTIKVPSVG